ncbi:PrgI family protein, partial [Mediterraneibacter gnavus]
GEERLQILYETFNPEEKVPFQFSYDRILRSGMGTKDFVAPTSFVFKEGKTFQMGNTIGAASYLQILAPELTDKMLAEFLDMNRNLIVNLYIQSIDQMKAIKLVKNKVTDINRMKIEEQKKAVRAGYDIDIIPSDLNTYGGEAKRLLEDLQSRNERMFLVTVLFLNTAKTKQELDNAVFQTAGIAQKYNCSLRRLDYMQEQGLMSSVPLGMNMIPIKRALTTTSTAIFVPFTTQELFMGGESLYYGLNALSNNMIMVDRKKLKNPNGLILGTPGCFTGETKLLLPDGRKVSFLELLAKKEEVLVNSFDFQKQELVKARGYDVRCTKEVTELVEVELENGETVRCTPDHWFLTQSAGYVEACNLKVGAKFIPEHEVKAVRFLNLEEAVPVYDISVEGYQNFLLSCGVVVHNSGKSFAAKREIANVFFATQDDIIIGDPEGEYYPLVHALGGQVIHISPTSHDYINPMDINLDYSDDDNPLGFKSDFILSLCELIMGSRNGIEAEEKSVIDRCLPLVYQKYFENPIPENMPVLGDLYDCLRKQEEVQAQRIATALEIYVNGSLNVFNHHTNVELNNRIVCFDIKDLGKQLKKLGMLIVQDQVWNRVTVNRVAHKSTRYYIDEFHLLLKEEQTAAYSVEIWKRFRKWGGKQSIILKILQRSIVYAVLIEAEGNN